MTKEEILERYKKTFGEYEGLEKDQLYSNAPERTSKKYKEALDNMLANPEDEKSINYLNKMLDVNDFTSDTKKIGEMFKSSKGNITNLMNSLKEQNDFLPVSAYDVAYLLSNKLGVYPWGTISDQKHYSKNPEHVKEYNTKVNSILSSLGIESQEEYIPESWPTMSAFKAGQAHGTPVEQFDFEGNTDDEIKSILSSLYEDISEEEINEALEKIKGKNKVEEDKPIKEEKVKTDNSLARILNGFKV